MDQVKPLQQLTIEVKTPDGFKVLRISSILYIEAAGKCSIVYLVDFNTIITYHMLKWYEIKLPKSDFFRSHVSYIINCRFIDCYNNKEITLKGKKKVSIARNRVRLFKENLRYLQEEYY
jgi:two-component system, LytTR family, response regulator